MVSRSQTILRARRLSHITSGAYNQNIDKRLARNMVWLRETRFPVYKLSSIGSSQLLIPTQYIPYDAIIASYV